MRNNYTMAIGSLQKWVEDTNQKLGAQAQLLYTKIEVQFIQQQIYNVACYLNEEYPFYASELLIISQGLFLVNNYGTYTLNSTCFGGLIVIMRQLSSEPINVQFWVNVHPRITSVSKGLFSDGYPDSAAEKAIKELETRLRELFGKLKPNAKIPAKIGDIIGALLSEDGAFEFCDTTTVSGKDYRRGVKALFEGVFAAYRNPAAHENIPCSKRESIEQIILASQLMYILDKE